MAGVNSYFRRRVFLRASTPIVILGTDDAVAKFGTSDTTRVVVHVHFPVCLPFEWLVVKLG